MDPIEEAKKALEKAIGESSRAKKEDFDNLGGRLSTDLSEIMEPLFMMLADKIDESNAKTIEAIGQMRVEAPEMPEMHMPEIHVPEPKVTVNVPEAKIVVNPTPVKFPDFPKYPEQRPIFNDVNFKNPLPVILTDFEGKPYTSGQIMQMGGVGGFKIVTIGDIKASAFSGVSNADGRLRVSVETGGSGITDSEIRATALPVSQVSGANWSVSVTDIFGSLAADVVNPDGRLKVELPTGSSGLTDTELRATAVPVAQLSGASWSTFVASVSDIFSTTTASTVVNPDNRVKVELPDTSVSITGSVTSTVAVGDIVADAADTGSAPIKVGGIARTANPTAVAAGDRVASTHDDLGRQVFRPLQVRDLTRTAYVSLTNGTETTLISAVAGAYLDLVQVIFANSSDAAVMVDLRPVTAGNIITSVNVPAGGTAGFVGALPLPQNDTGNNWTADMPDITGTTVNITGVFVQEV